MALPNSYYDPRQGHILYNRYLDELELGDELGFDVLCVNEHHQTAYGLMPTPGVLAGALSRRTKRARIAVLGRALPLLNNPLSVAEEYAILDNITGGRLIAGFVRGIGVEYHSTGANPAKSHARFHEAHDLILQAWTRTGPFAFEGKHYQFQYVNLWPRPYQQPHPPVWIPSQGSSETIEWASHPDRKYTYLQTFSPVSAVKRFHTQYKETAARYGYQASPDKLGWALPVYVSDSDEAARREAKPHVEAMFNKFLRMPQEYLLPPGYTSVASMKRLRQAKSSFTVGCAAGLRRVHPSRHVHLRQSGDGAPDPAAPSGRHWLQRPGRDDADRQHAGRAHAQEHDLVRAEGDAEAARPRRRRRPGFRRRRVMCSTSSLPGLTRQSISFARGSLAPRLDQLEPDNDDSAAIT